MIKNDESGAVFYFVALLLVFVIGSLSYTVNLTRSRSLQSELQNIVDGSAQIAASTLCSTKKCYDDSLEIALKLISEKLDERFGVAAPDTSDKTASTWSNDDVRITVRRGRWGVETEQYFPKINPEFLHMADIGDDENGNRKYFMDFDAVTSEGQTWDEINSEAPNFFLANAIHLKVGVDYKNSFFNILNLSESPLTAQVYALSGDLSEETCVAPFALPICALLDDTGEIDKVGACKMERFFTESERYTQNCADPADCAETLPGTHYVPFPQEVDLIPLLSQYLHYQADGIVTDAYDGNNTAINEYFSYTCDFNTRRIPISPLNPNSPPKTSVADHYGLIGIPDNSHTSIYPNTSEETVRDIVNQNDGCVKARIGDRFSVLHEGLTEFETDQMIWDRISKNRIPLEPDNQSVNVPYSEEFERTIFNIFVPSKNSYFSNANGIYERDLIEKNCEGYNANNVRHGVCNSRRFEQNSRCLLRRGLNVELMQSSLYTPEILACPLDPNDTNPENPSLNPVPTLNTPHEGPRKSWHMETIADNTNVWRVAIPVVSTYGEEDRRCSGLPKIDDPEEVQGLDVIPSDELEYYIIGFVNMIFYDTDIGRSPPARVTLASGDADLEALNIDLITYRWGPELEPWSFNKGTVRAGKTTGCNLVKGMIDCKQGLLSSPQFRRLKERKVTLRVPE